MKEFHIPAPDQQNTDSPEGDRTAYKSAVEKVGELVMSALAEGSLQISVEELDLPLDIYNTLKLNGIDSVSDLLPLSQADLRDFRGISRKGYVELLRELGNFGIKLRKE